MALDSEQFLLCSAPDGTAVYVYYGKNLSQTELEVYYLGMVTDHVSYIDLNLNVFSFVVFNWLQCSL